MAELDPRSPAHDDTVAGGPDGGSGAAMAATVVSGEPGSFQPSVRQGELARGSCVDRFVIEERLGAGAMGVVYAAHDPALDRRVAIKLIRATGHDEGLRARLYREAQALARVAHPNVVVVHEVGSHDQQVFVAMELVRGQTLRAYAASGPSQAAVLRVLIDAGRGLAAAHAAELVHRDFKPDNVLIGDDGRARVTDFGLARVKGDSIAPDEASRPGSPITSPLSEALTETGTMVGTPVYASPEQLHGERVGPASDQFSFCITAYEALYGRRPFTGATLGELVAQVSAGAIAAPPAGRRVAKRIHHALLRGLRPRPEDRHPSMDALLAELAIERRSVRWPIVAGGAVIAAGATAAIAFALSGSPEPTCSDEAAVIEQAWNADTSRRLHDKLAATGVGHATRLHASIAGIYGRYAAAWVALKTTACTAKRSGDVSADRTLGCLEHRRKQFAEHVEAIMKHPKIGGIPGLGYMLEPVATCVRPAGAPARFDDTFRARETMLEAHRLWVGGQHERAHRTLEDLAAKLEPLGYEPIRVEVMAQAAQLAGGDQDYARAEAILRRALALAETAGDDRTKTLAAARLAAVLVHRGQLDEAAHMADLAEAALAGLGVDISLEAQIIAARARLAWKRGQLDEAARLYERAIELYAQVDEASVDAMMEVTQVYTAAGRHDAAKAMQARTANLMPGVLADAPDGVAPVTTDENTRAGIAVIRMVRECDEIFRSGDLARARVKCGEVVAAQERDHGVGSLLGGPAHFALAVVLELSDDRRAAREHYLAAAKIFETHGVNDQLAPMLEHVARQSLELGELDDAIAQYRRSIAVASALGKPAADEVVIARTGLGRALATARQLAAAIAELEWALPRLEVMASPLHNVIARAQLALADALWQRNAADDRPRARVLAASAKRELAIHLGTLTTTDPLYPTHIRALDRLAAKIDSWRASHR